MPKFNCPHCSQSIDAPDELVGADADCPACGKSLTVPQAGGNIELPPPPESEYSPIIRGVPIEKPPREGITAVWIDNLLEYMRRGYFSDFFEKNERFLVKYGLYGLYFVACLGLLCSAVISIKYDLNFLYSIGIGIAFFFFCIVSHYIAWKFLPVLANLINNTPTKVSSSVVLDSIAFLSAVAGVLFLSVGLYIGVTTSDYTGAFLIGIFLFIFCEYMVSLCLNPKSMNIEISKHSSAGEEFLGLISFLVKVNAKLAPIMFGSGVLIGIAKIVFIMIICLTDGDLYFGDFRVVVNLAVAAFVPVTAYFVFLLYYFFIDLAMAVLAVPSTMKHLKTKD